MQSVLISTALVLAVIAAPARADRAHPPKPSAPVTLTMTARPSTDAGVRIVTIDAVATRDVPAIELRIDGASTRFGATRAGEHRRFEARIAITAAVAAGAGVDVIGSARVGTGTRVRSRTTSVRIGAAAKPAPFVVRTVDGKSIAEVRE
jgi:hypothetical protein